MKQASKENTPLRKLQLAELDVLKELIRICKKYNLTYYISGGTYLGAVRHKGFIPWDDDMDIAMPRPDFEKFLKLVNEIDKNYELVTFQTHSDYNWYPPKLRNNKVKVKNTSTKNAQIESAWIDIFPLDGMPKNKILATFHKIRLSYCRLYYVISDFDNIVNLKKRHRPFYEKIIIAFFKKVNVSKIIDTKKALYKIDGALKKYPYEKSSVNMNYMGAYRLNSIIPKTVYAEGALYDFEGLKLNGPKDYDTYLTQIYGDYMTPPRKTDQNKHNTEVME